MSSCTRKLCKMQSISALNAESSWRKKLLQLPGQEWKQLMMKATAVAFALGAKWLWLA